MASETYWCPKCDKDHRETSSIGSWHRPLRRKPLADGATGLAKKELPSKPEWCAAIALGLAIRDAPGSWATVDAYTDAYTAQDFAVDESAEDALASLEDRFKAVVRSRHSGREWLALEASTTNHVIINSVAGEYATLGMSFGVRHL